PDDVIAALNAAIEAQPGAVNYHYALVSLLLEQERFDEAEARLEAMKRVARNQPGTLYLQAFMDFRKNNLEAAREGVDEVLRQVPNHLLADLLAGNIHLRLNDHVRARQHLERVVARAPGQPLARRALAASYLATGDAAR
ncbi:tetratricopeptide repeat protein, partial [Arthrospira platensis SPKY2]